MLLCTGGFLESPENVERQAVKSRDINLYTSDGRTDMIRWLVDLQTKLIATEVSIWGPGYISCRTNLIKSIDAMTDFVTTKVPILALEKKSIFLSDTSVWLNQDSVAVISAIKGFKYTCFSYSDRYKASRPMNSKTQRWFQADIAGDGVNPVRFHTCFTAKDCIENIAHEARFITTGMSSSLPPKHNKREKLNLCHFYPIATHVSNMSGDVSEAFEALARSLYRNKIIAEYRYARGID